MAVGVGKNVSKVKLDKFATIGHSYLVSNFNEIERLEILKDEKDIRRVEFIAEMRAPIGLSSPLLFKLTMNNQSNQEFPKNTIISFSDDHQHFMQSTIVLDKVCNRIW